MIHDLVKHVDEFASSYFTYVHVSSIMIHIQYYHIKQFEEVNPNLKGITLITINHTPDYIIMNDIFKVTMYLRYLTSKLRLVLILDTLQDCKILICI